jgi:hypothetical protein
MSEQLAAIKKLYFATTKATIGRDFDHAIDLLKSMASEDDRERAAVYMEGLAQLRVEWRGRTKKEERRKKKEERNRELKTEN